LTPNGRDCTVAVGSHAVTDLLQPGQVLAGRFRIERFLAQGGFGAVFVAEQLATETRVALKVLWPQILSTQSAVERFMLEARVAGRVRSEHIVRVLDAGLDEQTRMPFLAMELLEGRDVQRLIEQHGPLPPDLVVGYLRQVASGLDKAHAYVDREGKHQPIAHRDLKPENLFVTQRDDGTAMVKILDFGIAKVLSQSANVSTEVKGTPLFMAYEQACGASITPQTDIWALGLIAFYMLTGVNYWRAANNPDAGITQLFGEVLSLPIVPPSQRLSELGRPNVLPPAFDAWFLCVVNRDQRQRPPTAGATIEGLAAALGFPVLPQRAQQQSYAGTSDTFGPAPGLIGHSSDPSFASPATSAVGTAGAVSLSSPGPAKRSMRGPLAMVGAVLVVAGVLTALALGGVLGGAANENTGLVAEPSAVPAASVPTVAAPPNRAEPSAAEPSPEPAAAVTAEPEAADAGAPVAAKPPAPAPPKRTSVTAKKTPIRSEIPPAAQAKRNEDVYESR
jgi:serine/threonine-protein kinase